MSIFYGFICGSEACYNCLAPGGLGTDSGENFGIEGQIYIDSRAEFNEPEVILDGCALAGFGICDDTPSDGSCDLTHKYLLAVVGAYDYGGALVFGA